MKNVNLINFDINRFDAIYAAIWDDLNRQINDVYNAQHVTGTYVGTNLVVPVNIWTKRYVNEKLETYDFS